MSQEKKFQLSKNELNVQFDNIDKIKSIYEKKYKDKTLLAHVHSYGCQQNVSDGEKIKGMLALMGYGFCDSPDEADLVIYNTCAVRENAEDRVFGNVGALKHKKRRNPDMLIGLCGCMTQQEHIAEKIKKSYPHVDFVFGTHALPKLPEIMYDAIKQNKRIFDINEYDDEIVEGIPIQRDQTFKAWLPIMYGCNNFCTYCIVPYVRGRERSRTSAEIVKEFKGLVAQGYKEITLLGQNVNSYGKGLEEDINFSQLLRMLNEVKGDFRIRFMSSHPKDATKELIDAIADCDKVCKHFHLPVQCGSDRILQLMNRHYTIESYMELIDYARKKVPDIAFTSDIIVGFPQEKYEDFKQTVELVKKVRFDSIFSFIYSKRVGTKAAEMEDPISVEEKSNWFQELLETQRSIGKERYKECVGKTYRILVEGEGKTGAEYLTGRNDGYMIVDFKGEQNLIGQFVNVKITQALNWALLGEIVE
ncbi:tRNA (N6-isopentenyl adenosine(37)-C2)-methylthiotransferase MiaB [Paludicola sp. MB14-C6]|uniref:tRNA (N6-isopentenyl adenosine(37)-C2)-methylthiotransferase MiaB n=1 Tax=Paludihabitans sp. MB14-C6 TaxID=3070656 RepID=UPI0027DE5C12|nr:tRNA (N6-isopentenyl adenosine(37)-C2)-methylthiotransferase MiaB [Paludicola sp. MB14-C6]WMJ23103.1 tRNA (N6-isopentenyl adenosine(37)-C2)-methylthiotransferase MiaB [Paludicola sp. MB14-C6]